MMPNRDTHTTSTNLPTDNLRIWQQNCRKSIKTQTDLCSRLCPKQYDLCLIQEPYIDSDKFTRAPTGWTALYPPTHGTPGAARTRSVILVSPRLGTDICTTIPILSADITAVQVETQRGSIRIFNVYNDQNHNLATDRLRAWKQDPKGNTLPPTPTYSHGGAVLTIWAGDFNRHHPLWDENDQHGLFTPRALAKAEDLIEAVADAGLEMAMPKDVNTLRTSAGNLTRPDNVFMTPDLLEHVVQCMPSQGDTPNGADHFAIHIVIDIKVDREKDVESYLWKAVDKKEFRDQLSVELADIDPKHAIDTVDQIERAAIQLDEAMQRVVKKLVEVVTISRHTRRWWLPELTKMRDTVCHLKLLRFIHRNEPNHHVHAEYRTMSNMYKNSIDKRKREHWRMFIVTSTWSTRQSPGLAQTAAARDYQPWPQEGTSRDSPPTRPRAMRNCAPYTLSFSHRRRRQTNRSTYLMCTRQRSKPSTSSRKRK
jgi:hypothetical protein